MKYTSREGFWRFTLFAIMLAMVSSVAWSQATTGSILGATTDSTGAVIRGVAVTATDEDKGVTFKAVSDATGNYTLLNLPPGVYTVTASATGFGEARYNHVVLVIDQHIALNFKLKVGNVSASIEVNDAPPMLQTQTAEVGTVISGDAITDLPLAGRNFYALTLLVPGVTTVGGSINSFALSVSGQREFANSIQLDGIESTTNRTQDVTVAPNVDSVEEFKVTTASYNAEFGNAAGGVIEVQTKAGTNKIHGDAFEFFRPNFLTARETLPGIGTSQPASILKQHNFGGILGGPIKKDRAFLFGAYEGVRQKNAYAYVDSTVPFGLINVMGNGAVDFSHLVDPCSGKQCTDSNGNPSGPPAGTVDPIYDPLVTVNSYGGSETQFAGNIIPASRVSKAGLNTLLNFFPKPNLAGVENGWFKNYEVFSPTNDNSDKVDSRFDQAITNNDRLYAVYHWQQDNSLVTDPYYGHTTVPGGGDADQANKEDVGAQSISLTYDRTISPTALNEFRFGYLNYHEDLYSLLSGTDYSSQYGVGNVSIKGYPATVGYPQIYMADGYLAGGSTYKPYHVLDQNYQFTDTFTLTRIARHELKFGGDLRLLNSHPNFSLFPTGFDFFDSYGYAETSNFYLTYIPGAYNYAGGSDLADLVLGLPTDVDIGLQLSNPHTRSWNLDVYGQDSYKVTPRLTLNFGLRYEYQDPWVEANNNMSNFDITSSNILLAGRAGASRSLIDARANDFSPRFGFAWTVDPKTVLRAGGAIFYSPENDGREDILTQNFPFATQAAYTNWTYDGPSGGPTAPWQYTLDNGVARSTTISIPQSGVIVPSTIKNGNLETTYSVNPKMKTGTTGSFNLTAQRQVTKSISLEVGYVGSISRHLSYAVGDINADRASTSTSAEGFLTPDLGKIQYLTDSGISRFDSMQVKVTQQMSRNTSFLMSYTWSHSLDNGPAPFNLGHINDDQPQNPYNLRDEYASSDTDLRQNFVFSGVQNLPFGQGQRWGANWGPIRNLLFGGWRYSPIATLHSGTPVNVVAGNDPNSADAGYRPNVTGNPNVLTGKKTIFHWFNTEAFTQAPGPKPGEFVPGDAGRNLVTGPGYANLDSSLAKDFKWERYTLQVRAEAFNTFNTVHYSNPNSDLAQPAYFGTITSVIGGSNRLAQLAAKIIF